MAKRSATTILRLCTARSIGWRRRLVEQAELPWHPSFFEMMTAIAFEYFAREQVDLAVLEVGMGGRLDATNVVEPRVSVITDISLDHQKFLGNTVGEIAREKVGIIRPGGVVVTLPQQPEANDVIGNTILELGARAVNAVPYVPPVSPGSGEYLSLSAGTQSLVPEYRAKQTRIHLSLSACRSWGSRFWWRRLWWGGISCAMLRWRLRRRWS